VPPRAWARSHISLAPFASLLLGSLGACLGGRLPANAMRVRLDLGLAAGGGAASPSVLTSSPVDTQKLKVFKTGSSAMPHSTNKKLGNAACRAILTPINKRALLS